MFCVGLLYHLPNPWDLLGRMAAATGSGGTEGGGLPYTSVHANYWLSGLSGHVIKHEMNLPLVCTFHTLDRVKAESMPEEVEADMPHRRAEAEASIIDCSDAVLASCTVEADQIASLYGGEPGRIRIVPPGVDLNPDDVRFATPPELRDPRLRRRR